MTCTVEGCTAQAVWRGMCWMHYGRWRRTGDPLGQVGPYRTPGCIVPGCDRPHRASGLCRKHYDRKRAPRKGARV